MIKLEECPVEIQKQILSKDKMIRRSFAYNCEKKYLPLLINDTFSDVVYVVANRIDGSYLHSMQMNPNIEGREKTIINNRILKENIKKPKCTLCNK